MRLFLACLLPDAVARDIVRDTATVRQAAPAVRWIPVERLHLTLKFLGDVAEGDVPPLRSAVGRAASGMPPFEATITGAGAFPNFSRPRVVWLAMHPASSFSSLAGSVDRAAQRCGFAPESRPFVPHLTVGRISGALPRGQADALENALGGLRASWALMVRDVALVRSTLGSGGPRYDTLATLSLGAR